MQETQDMWVWALDQKDPLEKEMAIHSSILAWKIPWIEEPGEIQSIGFQRVGHNWAQHTTQVNALFESLRKQEETFPASGSL